MPSGAVQFTTAEYRGIPAGASVLWREESEMRYVDEVPGVVHLPGRRRLEGFIRS
jgi:hypothetical protein